MKASNKFAEFRNGKLIFEPHVLAYEARTGLHIGGVERMQGVLNWYEARQKLVQVFGRSVVGSLRK